MKKIIIILVLFTLVSCDYYYHNDNSTYSGCADTETSSRHSGHRAFIGCSDKIRFSAVCVRQKPNKDGRRECICVRLDEEGNEFSDRKSPLRNCD